MSVLFGYSRIHLLIGACFCVCVFVCHSVSFCLCHWGWKWYPTYWKVWFGYSHIHLLIGACVKTKRHTRAKYCSVLTKHLLHLPSTISNMPSYFKILSFSVVWGIFYTANRIRLEYYWWKLYVTITKAGWLCKELFPPKLDIDLIGWDHEEWKVIVDANQWIGPTWLEVFRAKANLP